MPQAYPSQKLVKHAFTYEGDKKTKKECVLVMVIYDGCFFLCSLLSCHTNFKGLIKSDLRRQKANALAKEAVSMTVKMNVTAPQTLPPRMGV